MGIIFLTQKGWRALLGSFVGTAETETDVARITDPIKSQLSSIINIQLPYAGFSTVIKKNIYRML